MHVSQHVRMHAVLHIVMMEKGFFKIKQGFFKMGEGFGKQNVWPLICRGTITPDNTASINAFTKWPGLYKHK